MARRRAERTVVSAVGEVRYARLRYRCGKCGGEHAPLDGALGVVGEVTAHAAQMGLSLLVEMPSRRASDQLARLCGVRLSSATLDRLKERIGGRVRRWLGKEEERWLAPVSVDRPAPGSAVAAALLVRQADAVKVRYRDGWHDVKVGVSYGLGEVAKKGERAPVCPARYCAVRGEADTLGAQLQALSLSQGLRQAGASQFLSDGGNWMRGLAEGILSWSEWSVDYYHVSQQTASATAALYGEGSSRAHDAHERLKRKLLEPGGNGAVRRALRAAQQRSSLAPPARRSVSNVVNYLAQFQEQTRYDRLRQRAWPIGSGAVEGGACKLYIQQRFKRPGARWTPRGFDALEALRRLAYNDQWDKLPQCIHSQN